MLQAAYEDTAQVQVQVIETHLASNITRRSNDTLTLTFTLPDAPAVNGSRYHCHAVEMRMRTRAQALNFFESYNATLSYSNRCATVIQQ